MPILEIDIVTRTGERLPNNLARSLADAAGDALDTSTGQTWVKLRTMPVEHYAENGCDLPADVSPVFVTVLKVRLPDPKQLAKESKQLAETIARVCDRPSDNVHILYLPSAIGRMAFGGNLVTA